MRKQHIAGSVSLAVAVIGLIAAVPALLPGEAAEPIEVTIAGTSRQERSSSASLVLRNTSSKPITGYVLAAEFLDSAGKSILRHSAVYIRGEERPGSLAFAPGETWNGRLSIPHATTGEPLSPEISIDYIVFSDGTTSGRDSLHLSHKIKGIMEGWGMAIGRLRGLLQRDGPNAVIAALEESTSN